MDTSIGASGNQGNSMQVKTELITIKTVIREGEHFLMENC